MSSGLCFLATRATDLEMMLRPLLDVSELTPYLSLQSLVGNIGHDDTKTGLRCDLSNTGSHETGTKDGDAVDASGRGAVAHGGSKSWHAAC